MQINSSEIVSNFITIVSNDSMEHHQLPKKGSTLTFTEQSHVIDHIVSIHQYKPEETSNKQINSCLGKDDDAQERLKLCSNYTKNFTGEVKGGRLKWYN